MMLNIEKVGIVTNLQRDGDFSKTMKITKMLKELNITPVLPKYDIPVNEAYDALLENSDLIVTLGGDGTILSIAEKAAMKHIPIMGINIGNLGYLTDCSFEDAEKALNRLIAGNYICQKRMMLKAQAALKGSVSISKSCLNDVCIVRGTTSKIIRFDLYINDNFVDNYSADGIIISTPTGSTAYNLSAGGPILNPSSEMIAVTPICPHMLTSRPIVVASSDRITVKIGPTKKETMIALDGQTPILLNNDDIITIERAQAHADIIKTNEMDFYDILRNKLINVSAVDM